MYKLRIKARLLLQNYSNLYQTHTPTEQIQKQCLQSQRLKLTNGNSSAVTHENTPVLFLTNLSTQSDVILPIIEAINLTPIIKIRHYISFEYGTGQYFNLTAISVNHYQSIEGTPLDSPRRTNFT